MERTIPTIVGVCHHPSLLQAYCEYIDSLKAPATIGLELDYAHPGIKYPKEFLKVEDQNRTFFTKLAKHAEFRGHKVVWIERPSSFNMGEKKGWEKLLKERGKTLTYDFRVKGNKRLFELKEKLGKITNTALFCTWRSKVMAHEIRKREWNPGDLVFVGEKHAKDLAKEMQTDWTALDLQTTLRTRVLSVVGDAVVDAASAWLKIARGVKKTVNRFRIRKIEKKEKT